MSHRNAPLPETGRLRLARCVVEDGWSLRRAAERFQVSATDSSGRLAPSATFLTCSMEYHDPQLHFRRGMCSLPQTSWLSHTS